MSDPDFFAGQRVAVIGLGLMGGSLALALKGSGARIWAYDPAPDTVALAQEIGAAERVSTRLEDILPGSNIIFLCAPVKAIIQFLQRLPTLHPTPAIVLDIGSTKKVFCQAMDDLPERFEAVGCHPMCGKAATGFVHARQDLFAGSVFALCATSRTTAAARDLANGLTKYLLARSLWMQPEIHDEWVAATSHLPYLLSLALTLATPLEAAPLAGPGFRSTSRLAGSSVTMMADTLATNQANLLGALQRFRGTLDMLEQDLLSSDYPALTEKMEAGSTRLAEILGTE